MERVIGIGGVFFRGKDAEALRAWYAEHLGIDVQDWGGAGFEGGTTIWTIFAGDTEYFSSVQQSMVNYRVSDLDAMLEQLRAAGASVDDKVEDSEFGRFGWATDSEGNRFELWQPPDD